MEPLERSAKIPTVEVRVCVEGQRLYHGLGV